MFRQLFVILVSCLFSFSAYCQENECSISIIPRDTALFSTDPIQITLSTDDSADYYTWYCNGQIIDSCSPTITLTLQPGDTNQYVVKAGFIGDTNYIPNPYFDDGFTGFSVDSSLSISDTLLYNSGHYNIGVSTSDFVSDICHTTFANNVVTSISNGTNALMVAPHDKAHQQDTITIYKTKFQVSPQKDYVFYYSDRNPVHNCYQQGWASTLKRLYINSQIYEENMLAAHFDNGEVDYWYWSCDYFLYQTFLQGGNNFHHSRTERFYVPNDTIEIELKAIQASTGGFSNAFYILDSLEVKEICYAYDTINISVINEFTPFDTLVDISACEEDFPLYFRDNAIHNGGVHIFSYKDSINFIDTIFSVNVVTHPSYSDTIHAQILKGKTYLENNFSEKETGIYTQTLTAIEGCDSVIVLDLRVINLRFPTVVTANGDGINDVFEIKDLLEQECYTHTHLVIYNRSGKKIYDKMNIKDFEDFFSPHKVNAPSGTYFYRFTATNGKDTMDFTSSFEVIR